MRDGARNQLASRVTSFVGRDGLLADLHDLLRRSRLVTLVGPGGVGKSRLAAELDRRHGESFGAVAVVRLVQVAEAGAVEREMAAALGMVDHSARPVYEGLVEHLRSRGEVLVILDNCEHLWEEVGELVGGLIEDVPSVRILATSRSYLGVAGEHLVQVPPLSLTAVDHSGHSPAMTLLVDRMQAAGVVTDVAADESLAELVRWSAGLPLVLELIAVRLGSGLGSAKILERLNGGRLLSATNARVSRGVQPHHKTLHHVLDWSWNLCTEQQQVLLTRIAVFGGSFDLDAVEAVCSGGTIEREEVVDLMGELVQQSLVAATSTGRYRQLQPIREYGLRKLADSGEEPRIRTAHWAYFRQLAEGAATGWFSADEVRWLNQIRADLHNFRAAVNYCALSPETVPAGLEIQFNLTRARSWFFFGMLNDGTELLDRMLELADLPVGPERIGVTALMGFGLLCRGDQAAAAKCLDLCQDMARQAGITDHPALTFFAGSHALFFDASEESIPVLQRACAQFAEAGPAFRGDHAMAELLAAIAGGLVGTPDDAQLADQCLVNAEASGAEWAISWALWAKGLTPLMHGDPRTAFALMREALSRQVTLREKWGTLWSVEGMSWAMASLVTLLQLDNAAAKRAVELQGGAEQLQKDCGIAIGGLVPMRRQREQVRKSMLGLLDEAEYNAAYERGAAQARKDSEEFLMGVLNLGVPTSDSGSIDGLSKRQLEVALLIADGHTTKEIAAKLYLSTRTIEGVIQSLFGKLGVTRRAAIAAWVTVQRSHSPRNGQ
ncbi:LuxR C-terminal-related transcriptional regulator [Kibdelosporangium philippinense]|uniref:LuxR C-terminal-related transcriptional regulator n=1 Tax=Kibdelosporangium philippinense TaxID=211113 RepID=A0ABS8ZRN4_9PSEU|nr:LuxR C-terminal-related transcriptional regulator [Kibdelosporangium philippinense]MCE7010267.1 LuxR C-terminal-related transcriptional regulator [Kibdelosporangium philippinense]